MKLFYLTLLFVFSLLNASTAQVVTADYNDDNVNRDYYFIVHGSDGSQAYPDKEALRRKDILDMFISDSTTFHIRNKNEHQHHPHICQNRFHKFGLIGKDNTVQIPFEFEHVMHTTDTGFFIGMKNRFYGLMNNKGETILPFIYRYCKTIYDMLAMREKDSDSTLSFYSVQGKYLFPVDGYFADEKNFNYISIKDKKDFQKAVTNKKGKLISGAGNNYVAWIFDNYICCFRDRKYGITTLSGKPVIPFEYSNINPTQNDQFIVYKNGMSGIVDAKNNFIVALDSLSIANFGHYYIVGKFRSDDMSMINNKGEEILSASYTFSGAISYDMSSFKKINPKSLLFVTNNKTKLKGIYNADGMQVLPINNSYINYRNERDAIIFTKRSGDDSTKNIYGAININGKLIVPASFTQLNFLEQSRNLLITTGGLGKNTLINITTGEMIDYEGYQFNAYNIQLANGYFAASRNFKYALIAPDGKRLTEAIYSSLFPVTEKEEKLFDEEVVCLSRTREGLVGITKAGKEIAAKK